jgi:hypothetical protein
MIVGLVALAEAHGIDAAEFAAGQRGREPG